MNTNQLRVGKDPMMNFTHILFQIQQEWCDFWEIENKGLTEDDITNILKMFGDKDALVEQEGKP